MIWLELGANSRFDLDSAFVTILNSHSKLETVTAGTLFLEFYMFVSCYLLMATFVLQPCMCTLSLYFILHVHTKFTIGQWQQVGFQSACVKKVSYHFFHINLTFRLALYLLLDWVHVCRNFLARKNLKMVGKCWSISLLIKLLYSVCWWHFFEGQWG
jgi:hypothetical protein